MDDRILQLKPCVQKFVLAFLDAFPDGALASGRRGIDDQAQADAANTVQKRDFIQDTYVESNVKDAMVEVCQAKPTADSATLAPLFAATLGRFSDEELSHFSLHLSGYACDLSPVGDPQKEAWCEKWVADFISSGGDAGRSRVLTREAGLPRLHVQLLPATLPASPVQEA